MACDSLYVAWLKVHYPYELYVTMLKLFDEKKNVDKISSIIAEMKRYMGITVALGEWGQDNRDWLVDKENNRISQSLSSVRYMSKKAAEDLFRISQMKTASMGISYVPAQLNDKGNEAVKGIKKQLSQFKKEAKKQEITEEEFLAGVKAYEESILAVYNQPDCLENPPTTLDHQAELDCFINVLRALQMDSCLDARQIKILIELGYFSRFGGNGKLMKLYTEFFEGTNKLTKTIKSFDKRLGILREMEATMMEENLPIRQRLQSEQENVGLCFTVDPNADRKIYFVRTVDAKFGTTVKIYSIYSGKSGNVRFRKQDLLRTPVAANQIIKIIDGNRTPRYTYKDGKRTPIPGETEYWVKKYEIVRSA